MAHLNITVKYQTDDTIKGDNTIFKHNERGITPFETTSVINQPIINMFEFFSKSSMYKYTENLIKQCSNISLVKFA